MARKNNRYNQMQRYMLYTLLGDTALFILFLICAGTGVVWAKAITAILAILVSALCLTYLFLTKELLRKRSHWMSVAAGAILICVLFSLLLRFPSPRPVSSLPTEPAMSVTNQLD